MRRRGNSRRVTTGRMVGQTNPTLVAWIRKESESPMATPRQQDDEIVNQPSRPAEDWQSNEGRESELSRRATRSVLFTRTGLPGPWLWVLVLVFVIVALVTLGLFP